LWPRSYHICYLSWEPHLHHIFGKVLGLLQCTFWYILIAKSNCIHFSCSFTINACFSFMETLSFPTYPTIGMYSKMSNKVHSERLYCSDYKPVLSSYYLGYYHLCIIIFLTLMTLCFYYKLEIPYQLFQYYGLCTFHIWIYPTSYW